MASPTPQPPAALQREKLFDRCPPRVLALLAVGLAALFYVYPLALDIPLMDPDEGIHAMITQEMLERGDWITPRLYGKAFWDKPILFFWAQAITQSALGMNEVGVRLPGLLFGLLGNLTTGLLAWRAWGARYGILAGLFHATMVLVIALAQAAVHDVALVPWTNLALLSLWMSHEKGSRRRSSLHLALAGFWLGLAILTKGLIGAAQVGLVWGTFLLLTRRWQAWQSLAALGLSAIVALVVAAPWYLAMSWRNPGYLYYYFFERHVLGYATSTQPHGDEPWWYYLPVLAGGALPWIAYLPAAWACWRQDSRNPLDGDRFTLLAWIWLLGSLAFLSGAHSKLLTYLLPTFPAVALLAAQVWSRYIEDRLEGLPRKLLVAALYGSCLLGPAVLPVAMRVTESRFHIQHAGFAWGVAIVVSALAWAPLAAHRRGYATAAAALALAFLVSTFGVIMTIVVPPIASATSAKALAQYFNGRGILPDRLLVLEERVGSLVFYLEPRLRGQLRSHEIKNVWTVDVMHLEGPIAETLVAMPDKRTDKVDDWIDVDRAQSLRIGHYRLYRAVDLMRYSSSSRAVAVAKKLLAAQTGSGEQPPSSVSR